jgi:hypothetical protein
VKKLIFQTNFANYQIVQELKQEIFYFTFSSTSKKEENKYHFFFNRASKGRASLSPVTQEIPEAIRLARTRNAKPSSGDHLSTFEESQVDHEDNSNEAAQNLSQLTVTFLYIFCDAYFRIRF